MRREIVLITGMSGSGKSVALNALEDMGYFCIDNLPPELLMPLVTLELKHKAVRLAVAMDARSATSLHQVPELLAELRKLGLTVQPLFLDANNDTLVRRFSETRRRHPLSQSNPDDQAPDQHRALIDAIEVERELLAPLREQAHVIDTSLIRSTRLQELIKSLVSVPSDQLTLVFESFAFKRGIPSDADYVFDVRMLPNPHYEPELKDLTGQDGAVADYLRAQPDAMRLLEQIESFLATWLPAMEQNHRSYVTVAIGCTGGQHRSVFFVEQLAQRFGTRRITLKRHRELDLA